MLLLRIDLKGIHSKMNLRHERGERALNWIDRIFFGNTLTQKLHHKKSRRRVAVIGVLQSMAFGFAFGYGAWAVVAPNPISPLEKSLNALFWVALGTTVLIKPLVQKAVAAVIAIPGQTLDERQVQLFEDARSKAYGVMKFLLVIAMASGVGMLILVIAGYLPWSHPEYGGIPYYFGICGALFASASLAPYLILAWQLPDELSFDDEPHDDR